MTQNKGGRPAHEPTEEQRRMVESMAGYGVPQEGIAGTVGIDEKTLRKYYSFELSNGVTKANAKVAQSLYTKATGEGPSSVTAAIFWAKTRMGWKETSVTELSGADGAPLVPVVNVSITPTES